MKRLENKIALITGGASGIGEATAKLFAKEGATVIVADICEKEGKEVVETIGSNAVYMPLDVSEESQWKNAFEKIEADYGRLDILFNNAGIIGICDEFGPQDPEHASLESWQRVHEINLDSVFLGCKYGIQLMKKTGGSIVNMSSRSGMVGIPAAAAYASSKAAIRNHTKTVALWCAQQGYNIRCNSLHPAAILTPLWAPLLGETPEQQAAAVKKIGEGIPVGYMGDPDDVAYAVLYLASDESKYLTGSELTIDGGILAGATASPKEQ